MAATSSVGPITNPPEGFQNGPQAMYRENGRLNPAVLELLHGAIASAEESRGKDIVAVLGYTGCGKSTLVNHLLGKTIVYNRATKKFEVAPGEEEIAKIGQKFLGSETLYPKAYTVSGVPFTLLDCGGLLDTRGVNTDIAVASSIKLSLESANSVKLLICYESNAIFTRRCQDFIDFLNTILRSLVKNYADHEESIHLLFTKPRVIEGILYDKNSAIGDLLDIEEVIPEGPLKNLFQFLLREEGKYISVHNPRSVDSRISTLAAIEQLHGIANTRTAFRTFYANQSAVAIMEALTRISVLGLELYQRYFQLLEHDERQKTTLRHLTQRIEGLADQITRFGAGENNVEVIREIGERVRQQHLEMAREQNGSIEENERLKENTQRKINELLQKIDAWNIAGETIDLYWEDGINEKGIKKQSRIVTKTWTETSGFWLWKKTITRSKSYTVEDEIKIVSKKAFQYRGPELEEVVKTPSESPCWLREALAADKKSYSVDYESAIGVDAVGNVKVYVRRKNKPNEVDNRRLLENDHRRETLELARLEKAIHGHVILKNLAEKNATSQAHDLETILAQNDVVEHLRQEQANHQARLADLERQVRTVRDEIADHQPEFNFLRDFLRLSEDHEISHSEPIVRFVDLNTRYQAQTP